MSAEPLPDMGLRPYQEAGVTAALRELDEKDSTLVVWPTGAGKTVLLAKVAEAFVASGKRVLVIAHREELITQAKEKIARWTGLGIGTERAGDRALRTSGLVNRSWAFGHQPVVVASVQTLSRPDRLREFDPTEFGLVIVDEAHHVLANTYQAILDYFSDAKVLGVTATPDRSDELALGQIFQSAAHVYEIEDAIADGYLVPIRQHAVYVDGLDLSKLRKTAGDLNLGDLDKIMREEQHLHAIANPVFELSGDRPTLTFATTVEHARLLADQLNRRAGDDPKKQAIALDGSTEKDRRKKVLAAFSRGEFQHLVGCALFLEGFDEPRISCVAMARPTSSRALYAQAVGRGTRLSPETGKRDLLVLDFCGNAGKHQLVTAIDIFAGDMTPVERKEVEALSRANPGMNVEELVELAKKRAAEEEARQAALRARRNVVAGTVHRTAEINPFAFLGAVPRRGAPGTPGASPRQREMLAKRGLTLPADLDRAQAGRLIDALIKRQEQGLATYKQGALLGKFGIDASRMTFEQASAEIDRIAKNGWKR